MIGNILLVLVVFLTNIIQGITGFAGTALAMPFALMLIGADKAKIIFNILGLLASIVIVMRGNKKKINIKSFLSILAIILIGLVTGMILYKYTSLSILLIILPLFIIIVGLKGIIEEKGTKAQGPLTAFQGTALLISAGIMHGLFVVGGPILVMYANRKFEEKEEFRINLSLIWIVLNSILLGTAFIQGQINMDICILLLWTILPLFIGVYIGEKLFYKVNETFFKNLTYILLIVSGIIMLF